MCATLTQRTLAEQSRLGRTRNGRIIAPRQNFPCLRPLCVPVRPLCVPGASPLRGLEPVLLTVRRMLNNGDGMSPLRTFLYDSACAMLLTLCLVSAAQAQAYPVKPIRMIVPFAPG